MLGPLCFSFFLSLSTLIAHLKSEEEAEPLQLHPTNIDKGAAQRYGLDAGS
jgi:hypothetical protein